jgi:integrase
MRRRPGIYKRGNTYWITYSWQRRQYFESSHSSDIHDAEALLLRKKAELVAGRKPVRLSETLTVDELLDSYITQIEHPTTRKRYRLSQRALSLHCGTWRITDVDAFTFDRFKESRTKEGVSPAGVNRDLALPRAAFNFAVKRTILVHNPLDGVKLFNEAKHRKPPRTISFPQEQRILMCCDVRLRLIVTVLLYTGMRVGIEALRLKWSDIDFAESIITVAQSKTAAGLRSLPMTALVASELEKWRASTSGTSEYVFFNPQRPSTHIPSVKTAWHNALKLAGIPRFPIYQCRHNFATRLAGLGVSDTIIDQLLGHSRRDGSIRHESPNISETLSIC